MRRLSLLSTAAAALSPARFKGTKSPAFDILDPFKVQDLLSEEEKEIQRTVHEYAQKTLLPRIVQANRHEIADKDIFRELGALGALGCTIDGYGCMGSSYTVSGLISQELEAVDSGYRSSWSVQSSLVMHPIYSFGSEEQKQRFLPKLATGELIGCFGLTEPNAGSDPASMTTHAKKVDGGYVLNGEKMWITSAPLADVAVIWAKDHASDNKIRGFLVERSFQGFTTPKIEGKLSLRASCTGAVQLQDCFVPDANVLPDAWGLKAPFECLSSARLGISCGVVGAATVCYSVARDYTMQRKQFGRPLAGNQLVQNRLAEMLTEIGYMQQAALRATRLKDEGKLAHETISIVKRKNCQTALAIARTARDMLGGNGISDEYHVMRHMCNLETTNTYEGAHDVHALIIGRAITGLGAF